MGCIMVLRAMRYSSRNPIVEHLRVMLQVTQRKEITSVYFRLLTNES